MPIEIRELHIRVAVSAPSGGAPAGSPAAAEGGGGGAGNEAAHEALVAECVEQVLRILQQRMER